MTGTIAVAVDTFGAMRGIHVIRSTVLTQSRAGAWAGRALDPGRVIDWLGQRANWHPADAAALAFGELDRAELYAEAVTAVDGNQVVGPVAAEAGWVVVADLRGGLTACGLVPTDPALPDGYRGPWSGEFVRDGLMRGPAGPYPVYWIAEPG